MTEENKNIKQNTNKAPITPEQDKKKDQSKAVKKPNFFVRLFSKKPKTDVAPVPIKPEDKPKTDKKPNIFTRLFSKNSQVGTTQPAEQVGPQAIKEEKLQARPDVMVVTPSVTEVKSEVKVEVKVEDQKSTKKGNIFTKLFGKKESGTESNTSIIENIVAQTDKSKIKKEKEIIKKKEENKGEGLLKFSNIFLKIAIIFVLISAGFFYAFNIDENNYVLGMFNKENNAVQITNANQKLDAKKAEEQNLNKEIEKYKKGYINEYEKIITKIISSRMDWTKLMKNIDEVTESVYTQNALTKYVEYNNYAYDVKNGKLTISGTLSDPLGQNLTKMAELEEAFMYYPKTKNDSEDKRKPYFYNMQEFQTYTKTLDTTTNRYKSNFSISLYTKETSKQ